MRWVVLGGVDEIFGFVRLLTSGAIPKSSRWPDSAHCRIAAAFAAFAAPNHLLNSPPMYSLFNKALVSS